MLACFSGPSESRNCKILCNFEDTRKNKKSEISIFSVLWAPKNKPDCNFSYIQQNLQELIEKNCLISGDLYLYSTTTFLNNTFPDASSGLE